MKLTTSFDVAPKLRKMELFKHSPYIFMALCLNYRDSFTLTLALTFPLILIFTFTFAFVCMSIMSQYTLVNVARIISNPSARSKELDSRRTMIVRRRVKIKKCNVAYSL